MHVPYPFLLLLVICMAISCQQNNTDEQHNKLNSQSNTSEEAIRLAIASCMENVSSAINKHQLDSAFYWHQQAANLHGKLQHWDSTYLRSRDLFYLAYERNQLSQAKPYIKTILDIFPSDADTTKAKTEEILALIYYLEDDLPSALTHYKTCLNSWLPYEKPNRLAAIYNMLGIIYTIQGDYPLAESIYQEAIQVNRKLGSKQGEKDNHFNLGKAYLAQNQWKNAINSFEEGHALIKKSDGYFEASLAAAYLAGEQNEVAKKLAQQALDLNTKYSGRSHFNISSAHQLLGKIYLALGELSLAESHFQQHLNLALENYPSTHRVIGKAHIFLGDTYKEQGLDNIALREYHRAIKVFLPAFEPENTSSSPSNDSIFSHEVWLMEALRNKGSVYLSKFEKSQRTKELQLASSHFNTAVEYINKIKLYYTEAGAKSFLGDYSIPFIEDAIRSDLLLYERTNDIEHQKAAFMQAQQATAFLLREAVNEERAIQLSGLSPDSLAIFSQLNTDILNIQSAIAQDNSHIISDSLHSVLFQLKQKRLSILDKLQTEHPKYYQLKHQLQPASLEHLQAELDSNTLAIKYFFGERQLYGFAFSKNTLYSFTNPIDIDFLDAIKDYRKTLSNLDYIKSNPTIAEQVFIEKSHYLFQQLLFPAIQAFEKEQLNNLIIIPDGLLNYLSFECLLTKSASSWLEKDAYLINDYAIRYAYYTGLILQKEKAVNSNNRFLGFGTEYKDNTLDKLEGNKQDSVSNPHLQNFFRGKQLSKLAYADDEVKEVADMLNGKAYLNHQATKANFLSKTPDYEVIHVAAHSFIDTENDSTAYIVFNQDNNSKDFLLSLPEIYGLQLNANLITLSACQTGTGALQRSEGVMSLARAFQFAGSSSLIASQWSISDRASSLIMKDFYKALRNGTPKDEALRQAKLRYLTDDAISSPAYRIPAYWGAIVLIGDDAPLEFESVGFGWWQILMIGGVLLGILGMILYQRKYKN